MRDFLTRSWCHFTSWWVYPAVLATSLATLLIAPIFVDIESAFLGIRVILMVGALAMAYDFRVRRPRLEKGEKPRRKRR